MRASGPPTKRALLGSVAALTLSVYARTAQGAPFDLEWSAPAGCPTRERILAALPDSLGESDAGAPPELFVHGTVVTETDAIVVHLRVTDAAGTDLGERRVRFDGQKCAAIEEPTALLLGMMIAVARSRAPAPVPTTKPEPPVDAKPTPGPPQTTTKTPSHTPPATAPLSMTLGASAVASLGFLPNVGLGAAVRWTLSLSRLLLGVETSFETTWAERAGSGHATFRFFDVGAFVGWSVVRTPRIELVPVLQVRGGILSASATSFPSAEGTTRAVGIVAAGALGRVRLGPALHVDVLPDVRVPLAHDEFFVREGSELVRVHSTTPIEARLAIGVAWTFR